MPRCYRIGNILIFFWSNEYSGGELEPIHVHAWYKQVEDAPKLWVSEKGDSVWESGEERFSGSEKAKIEKSIRDNVELIFDRWKDHFGVDPVVNTEIFGE